MSPRYLVAAVLLAAAGPAVSAPSVKAGIEAWQHADYGSAVAIWRPLAEAGDADAQFNLGQAYRLGRGVSLNLAMAKTWFERAAGKGHVDAATTLGLLLFQNGDQAAGLKWLKQAAAQGEPRALLVYGTALYNGDGVTQDRLLGYAYVNRAAGLGLAPAKDTLSQLDDLMPIADRQKAIALSRSIPSGTPFGPAKTRKPERMAEDDIAKPRAGTPKTPAPKPQHRSPAASAAVVHASGPWRIQLGAFSQRSAAEAMYQRVSRKAALAGHGPIYVAAGNVTRLQVGGFASRAAASAACGSVGTACFPVPPG